MVDVILGSLTQLHCLLSSNFLAHLIFIWQFNDLCFLEKKDVFLRKDSFSAKWHQECFVQANSMVSCLRSISEADTSSEHGDTGPPRPSRPSSGPERPDEDEAGAGGMDWEPVIIPAGLPVPSCALVRRHLARAFWNHTYEKRETG